MLLQGTLFIWVTSRIMANHCIKNQYPPGAEEYCNCLGLKTLMNIFKCKNTYEHLQVQCYSCLPFCSPVIGCGLQTWRQTFLLMWASLVTGHGLQTWRQTFLIVLVSLDIGHGLQTSRQTLLIVLASLVIGHGLQTWRQTFLIVWASLVRGHGLQT